MATIIFFASASAEHAIQAAELIRDAVAGPRIGAGAPAESEK